MEAAKEVAKVVSLSRAESNRKSFGSWGLDTVDVLCQLE
jgi:hypothetical protein